MSSLNSNLIKHSVAAGATLGAGRYLISSYPSNAAIHDSLVMGGSALANGLFFQQIFNKSGMMPTSVNWAAPVGDGIVYSAASYFMTPKTWEEAFYDLLWGTGSSYVASMAEPLVAGFGIGAPGNQAQVVGPDQPSPGTNNYNAPPY